MKNFVSHLPDSIGGEMGWFDPSCFDKLVFVVKNNTVAAPDYA
jgi:hypothetical protein